jgi:hypothetical protein
MTQIMLATGVPTTSCRGFPAAFQPPALSTITSPETATDSNRSAGPLAAGAITLANVTRPTHFARSRQCPHTATAVADFANTSGYEPGATAGNYSRYQNVTDTSRIPTHTMMAPNPNTHTPASAVPGVSIARDSYDTSRKSKWSLYAFWHRSAVMVQREMENRPRRVSW